MHVLSAKELNNSSKSKGMVTRGRGGVLPHTYVFSAICQRNCFNLDIDIDIDIDILKNKKCLLVRKGKDWPQQKVTDITGTSFNFIYI